MTDLTFSASYDAADHDLCCRIGGVLAQRYPGHLWAVQADHSAGTANIRLHYQSALIRLSQYGYLLHIGALDGVELDRKVMRAGGEILERYGLRRCSAQSDAAAIAAEHGLDTDNAVEKSRH